jgi:hypothetical protein
VAAFIAGAAPDRSLINQSDNPIAPAIARLLTGAATSLSGAPSRAPESN